MSPSAPTLSPNDVVRRIGDTNEAALRYVLSPDPQLSRLSRKVREALIADLPPVTAGALLGPAALARHFVASAASGRYRDLFALWELFRQRPADCKPVLAERSRALEKARQALATAARLGLHGRAERVAADITAAQGLIWQWLREVVVQDLAAVGRRPAIASALLQREPELEIPLPAEPDDRWLAEAAAALEHGPLAPSVDALLGAHIERLPATVATLWLAQERYPDRVPALLERVDLTGPDIGSIMAWARDHGHARRLRERVRDLITTSAEHDRADSLALWYAWRERGVDLELPEPLRAHSLDGLDLSRPETAELLALLLHDGADLDPQAALGDVARQNRQLAEKAYEAFVCAGLDVRLPRALEANPIVRDGTRCPHCAAWTWVRPGHERRCPRRPAEPAAAEARLGTPMGASPTEPPAGPSAASAPVPSAETTAAAPAEPTADQAAPVPAPPAETTAAAPAEPTADQAAPSPAPPAETTAAAPAEPTADQTAPVPAPPAETPAAAPAGPAAGQTDPAAAQADHAGDQTDHAGDHADRPGDHTDRPGDHTDRPGEQEVDPTRASEEIA